MRPGPARSSARRLLVAVGGAGQAGTRGGGDSGPVVWTENLHF